jgi:hypothetical protein
VSSFIGSKETEVVSDDPYTLFTLKGFIEE